MQKLSHMQKKAFHSSLLQSPDARLFLPMFLPCFLRLTWEKADTVEPSMTEYWKSLFLGILNSYVSLYWQVATAKRSYSAQSWKKHKSVDISTSIKKYNVITLSFIESLVCLWGLMISSLLGYWEGSWFQTWNNSCLKGSEHIAKWLLLKLVNCNFRGPTEKIFWIYHFTLTCIPHIPHASGRL